MSPSIRELNTILAMFHCAVQGTLVPLLVKFFTSSNDRSKWFKAYILFINLAVLAQTVFRIVLGLQAPSPPFSALLAIPLLTILISSSVQAFFLFRCWNIFKRRLLPLIPYLVLWLVAIVFGLVTTVYLVQAFEKSQPVFTAWMICWFLLDLMITVTTVSYLYRSNADLRKHDGAFSIVWQVVWASAAPPLLVMFLTMVGQLTHTRRSIVVEAFAIGISEKIFILSLMITVVGRGYIREKLDRPASRPSLPSFTLDRSEQISEPVFAGENSGAYELQMPNRSVSPPASSFTQAPSEIDLEEHKESGSKIQAL